MVYTTTDNSWDVIRMIAQAGGGEVFPVGAQLSCTFNAPRVSIGTMTSDDIMCDVDVPGTASRRARRNTVIPRVRLESHGWEEVQLDAIAIPDYVAVDGGSRPTEAPIRRSPPRRAVMVVADMAGVVARSSPPASCW